MAQSVLGGKKITVVTHIFLTGPGDELVKYLTGLKADTLLIAHPFDYAAKARSYFTRENREGVVKKGESILGKFPGAINYVKDFLTTVYFSVRFGRRDIFIGINNLNAASGILLKKLGLVGRVVFYTIDYVPRRFENNVLNAIYHAMDRFAVKHADLVWNLSGRMVEAREKSGVDKKYREKQRTVPVGTEDFAQTKNLAERDRYGIVYMGHLRKGQGVESILAAFAIIKGRIPAARFHVYGTGPLEEELKSVCRKEHIDGNVLFHGAVASHKELLERISRHTVAVAPYADRPDNFTRYTDPGKVKAYLATALPIVMTDVPEVGRVMEAKNCAVIAADNPESFADNIIRLLEDEGGLQEKIEACRRTAKEYVWGKIFDDAFYPLFYDPKPL